MMSSHRSADSSYYPMEHFYHIKSQNHIYQQEVKTGKSVPYYHFKDLSKPKTVYTPDGKVFVLGGIDKSGQISGKCYQIVNKV